MILNPYNFESKNIKLDNKISYYKKRIYPIKYNNEPFIIQTPIVFLPWGLNTYNSIDIAVDNENKNSLTNFYNFIKSVEKYFSSIYYFKKYKFKSNIKKHVNYSDIVRISCDKSTVNIFNKDKEKTNIDSIDIKSFVKLIIQISFLWVSNGLFGIKWNVCQIKVYSDIIFKPKEYAFIDTEEEILQEKHIDSQHEKYFKMLKMGIPKIAVINKMKINGVDPRILDDNNENKKPIKNNNILLDLKKKLKKSEPIEKKIFKSHNKFSIKPEDLLNAITKIKLKSSNSCNSN